MPPDAIVPPGPKRSSKGPSFSTTARRMVKLQPSTTEAVFGPEHPDTGMHLNNLVMALWHRENFLMQW
jgi:hypothetical protein